jgi:hypothetical protein
MSATAPSGSGQNRVLAASGLYETLRVRPAVRTVDSPERRMRRGVWVVLVTLLLGGSPSEAQQARTSSFDGMTTFSCSFSLVTTAAWSANEPSADVKRTALSFQVKDVNTDEGSARFVDATSNVSIVSRLSGSNLYLLDIRPEGTLATLTVFEKAAAETKLRAVYTRTHYYGFNGPDFVSVPQVEQFYGYCEPTR